MCLYYIFICSCSLKTLAFKVLLHPNCSQFEYVSKDIYCKLVVLSHYLEFTDIYFAF